MRTTCKSLCCLLASLAMSASHAANWQVERVNHMLLTPPAGVTVAEMSGVTYIGPADGGAHRFIAAEETKGELVQFDLSFNASGSITGIANIAPVDVAPTFDFEGIAYTNPTRNSVFLADETNPGVREVSLATGAQLQNVPLPLVFANDRNNLSLESLTRSASGTVMWTANEQALTVDGAASTALSGTTVRLSMLNVAGDIVSSGPQYAYLTEPIHGTSSLGSPQSGLADLVAMPDGTLLALERSVSVTTPLYLNRIYEISFAGATDVSVGGLADGLLGQTYTSVGKDLRWSGAVDAANGQNLEGLTLGPKLANGAWVLVGVVDSGDGFSANTVVAFNASANPSADFDDDGDVDGADMLTWQRGFGTAVGAAHADGDADRDGGVDAADLDQWKSSFSAMAPTSVGMASASVPEPSAIGLGIVATATIAAYRRGIGTRNGAVQRAAKADAILADG